MNLIDLRAAQSKSDPLTATPQAREHATRLRKGRISRKDAAVEPSVTV